MNSVSNNIPLNYTAAKVGTLNPPERLARYGGLSDSEMERDFLQINGEINKKSRSVSFEDRKKTPVLVKFIAAIVGIFALFKGCKMLFKR